MHPWLVIQDRGAADDGLFARDADGKPLVFDNNRQDFASGLLSDIAPALVGSRTLADGRQARPVFELLAKRYSAAEYAPENVAESIGIPSRRYSPYCARTGRSRV